MPYALEQILGFQNLAGVITGTTMGVPDLLPPAFKTLTRDVMGDTTEAIRVTGTRRTARIAQYGSPAQRRDLKDVSYIPVKCLHTIEEQFLDVLTFQRLRAYESNTMQDLGRQELSRQLANFKQLFDNLNTMAVVSMLFTGKAYYDGSGNLLPSSSGAKLTIDYGINANNQNQLNSIIAASWATTTTDIPKHLRTLKKTARKLTGYPLKYAFYGENVPGYFEKNASLQLYLSRNPKMNEQYMANAELPDGLMGLTWIPVYESFFEDQNGTNQSFVNADGVTFCPEITSDLYELIRGSYQVPKTFQPMTYTGDLSAAFETVYGRFAYAVPATNPPTAVTYMGDTFLPWWKVPDALFQAVVAF